jgi:hypothetical protein
MRLSRHLSLGVFALAASIPVVSSSAGDRSVIFQQCVSQLEQRMCMPPPPRSWLSIVTWWKCADACRYECMHAVTDRLESEGNKPLQYYGKWPFWRVLGMQEPASVAFSLLNLYAHRAGALEMRKRIPEAHPLKYYYLMSAYVSMNAWVWSAVFHTRGEFILLFRALIPSLTWEPTRPPHNGEARLLFRGGDNPLRPVRRRHTALPPLSVPFPTLPSAFAAAKVPQSLALPVDTHLRPGLRWPCGLPLLPPPLRLLI